jgi:DNA-binding MarR family transcriptional regulator
MEERIDSLSDAVDVLDAIVLSEFGARLTWSERMVLMQLAMARVREEQLTMSELAVRSSLTRAAMTAILGRLEADGVAQRKPWLGDRRRVEVAITHSGFQALVSVVPALASGGAVAA